MKGQRIGTGQANVKAYNRKLRDLIAAGKGKASFIVSHELPLEKAPEGDENFDAHKDGWTRVVLKPGDNPGERCGKRAFFHHAAW
jgi:glutathione-independent formaldehyde dehydrogenase